MKDLRKWLEEWDANFLIRWDDPDFKAIFDAMEELPEKLSENLDARIQKVVRDQIHAAVTDIWNELWISRHEDIITIYPGPCSCADWVEILPRKRFKVNEITTDGELEEA